MGAREVLSELKKKYPNARHHKKTVVPKRKWPSFYSAALFLDKNRGWKMVHGTIVVDGERVPHAWCVRGGMVYDAEYELFLTVKKYEKSMSAISYSEEMSHKAFFDVARANGTYGPWLR